MPQPVEKCVKSVLKDNPEYSESRAYAICKAQHEADADRSDVTVESLGDVTFEADELNAVVAESPDWTRHESELGVAWVNTVEGMAVYEAAGTDQQAPNDFVVDVIQIVQEGDEGPVEAGALLGIGADMPNAGVYVDWNIGAWPDDEQLSEPHVSDYGTVEDLEQATGGSVDVVETVGSGATGASMGDGRVVHQSTPEGVPDDAFSIGDESECDGTVHEGPQGGLYCSPDDGTNDTGASTTDELMDRFDGDNAPDNLDITQAETVNSMGDVGVSGGHDADAMRIAEMPDGSRAFVRLGAESEEDIQNTALVGSVYNELLDGSAESHYDEATDSVVTEEVSGTLAYEADVGEVDEESFYDAMGASLLVGNWDVKGDNLMIDDDGSVQVFDYDSGNAPMTGEESDASEFATIAHNVATILGVINDPFSESEDIQDDIQSAAKEIADNIDESVMDELPEDSNMRDNIQSIQDGEFEW